MGLYSTYMDIEKADAKQECNLDTWYQMLAILYLLLIYCQVVVFWIFACVSISYMKRFFLIADDKPFAEQRLLSAANGGRWHPLARRSYQEYLHAFNYAFYIQSRVRINRTAELAYLQQYKNQAKEEEIKKQLISVVYKSSFKGKKSITSQSDIEKITDSQIDQMRKNLLDPAEFRDSPQLTFEKKEIDEEPPK